MSAITIKHLYSELKKIEKNMVTKEELERFLETRDILSHPETVRQLQASDEDIKHGRVKTITSVKDLLREA